MINRLFKEGLITTIIGLLIIVTSVIVWAFTDKTASGAATISAIGTGLLFVKDKEIGIK